MLLIKVNMPLFIEFNSGRRTEDEIAQRIFFNVKTDVYYIKKQITILSHQSNIIIANMSHLMNNIDELESIRRSLSEMTANITQLYSDMKKNHKGMKNKYNILKFNVSDVTQRFDLAESLWPGVLSQLNVTISRINDLSVSHEQLKQITLQQGHMINSGVGRLEQKIDASLTSYNIEISKLRNDIVGYILNVGDQVLEVQKIADKLKECSCSSHSGKFFTPRISSDHYKAKTYLMTSNQNKLLSFNPYSPNLQLDISNLISNISKIENQINRPVGIIGGMGSFLIFSNLPFSMVSNISTNINISGILSSPEFMPSPSLTTSFTSSSYGITGPMGPSTPPGFSTTFTGQYPGVTSETITPTYGP